MRERIARSLYLRRTVNDQASYSDLCFEGFNIAVTNIRYHILCMLFFFQVYTCQKFPSQMRAVQVVENFHMNAKRLSVLFSVSLSWATVEDSNDACAHSTFCCLIVSTADQKDVCSRCLVFCPILLRALNLMIYHFKNCLSPKR